MLSLTSPRPTGMGGRDGLPQPMSRGDRPQIMAAIGGIDIALWDIKGKAADVPVWQLLGGERKPLFTYATGGYYELDAPLTACADELAGFVKNGYRAVKLKTAGLSIAQEVERIRATRAAIGKDVLLMLDMNAAYDLEDCMAFARAVEPYDIYWLEEPLHWYLQPADFVRLAQATPIPLAHGEREMTRFTARDFITSGALGFMQFDATRFASASWPNSTACASPRTWCRKSMRTWLPHSRGWASASNRTAGRSATRCGSSCSPSARRCAMATCT
jgi:D-galactarolactone cycloisomerase